MITTQGEASSLAAQKMFNEGGNIIDAAIAASFAISVERPQSTGLGGGGFLLFREAKSKKFYAIDFRERAPIQSTETMFLDDKKEVVSHLSKNGILAVGVPGLVAGLIDIHKKFGVLPLKKIIQPAIDLAENGVTVYPHLAEALHSQKEILAQYPSSKSIFLKENGEPYQLNEKIIQKDLATTLRLIAEKGKKAFYQGKIADAIVEESKKYNGLLTHSDFKHYQVKWRKPVRGKYKGYEVVSFPPPSSGGAHVIQILNLLEADSFKSFKFGSVKSFHTGAQAMQQAFADRAQFMGDPDFNSKIPLKGIISKSYAQSMRAQFKENKFRSADEVKAGNAPEHESTETTNFSIMDAHGNSVVSTQTINGYFGSKVVASGTGIILNNEMDDFSAKTGNANLFGAIGGKANSIEPKKTPLSSMAPTLLLKKNKPVLALGSPGGTRIITCVAQTIINYVDHEFSLYDSISAYRFHHQWKPELLEIEKPGPSQSVIKGLEDLGYTVKLNDFPCRVNAVANENDTLIGVADPRDIGIALGE